MEIARIQMDGGALLLPARTPYEREVVLDHVRHRLRMHGFVHLEAIAYETAARFYRSRGFDQFADMYLNDARACYARWGADGKVKQLEQQNRHENRPKNVGCRACESCAQPWLAMMQPSGPTRSDSSGKCAIH